LTELIAPDLEGYEEIACRIARDRNYAQAFRSRIVHDRDSAPLFDSTTFTRDLEKLYMDLKESTIR
jgi:predicted O-linked N-acetylglucosamine transferase (SPINDLY family)